jgi:hypothetical protein
MPAISARRPSIMACSTAGSSGKISASGAKDVTRHRPRSQIKALIPNDNNPTRAGGSVRVDRRQSIPSHSRPNKARIDHRRFFASKARDCKGCDPASICLSPSRATKALVIVNDHPALLRARRGRERWSEEDERLYRRHRWRSEGFQGEANDPEPLSTSNFAEGKLYTENKVPRLPPNARSQQVRRIAARRERISAASTREEPRATTVSNDEIFRRAERAESGLTGRAWRRGRDWGQPSLSVAASISDKL